MESISLSMSLHRTIWNDMLASSPHASNLVIIIIIINITAAGAVDRELLYIE